MTRRVVGARVEFYNPGTGALRYTLTDDVQFVDIEESARDEADDCKIEVSNKNGAHTSKFHEGDEVRVYIQMESDASPVHIWTGIIDNLRHERLSKDYANIIIEAQDFVYYRLAHAYTTDTFEDYKAGAIIRESVQNQAGDIDVTNVLDTSKTIPSMNFNGVSLLQAIRRVAQDANGDWYGDKDKRLHYFEKGTKTSEAVVDAEAVVRGSFRVESTLGNFGNVIKVRGGSRAVLDQSRTVASPSLAVLSDTTRKTARVYVSKSSIAQIHLYTHPDGLAPSPALGDLRVRVQADNEAGNAPVEVGNPDRDILQRTLSRDWLANPGWTTFVLPEATVAPGSYVWIIVESATSGEGQNVGIDGNGNLLFKTYYPTPVIVERVDQPSVDKYGRRELPPINDKNISTEEEANLIADMALARSSTPQRNAEYDLSDFTVQKEATTNVLSDGDVSGGVLVLPYKETSRGNLSVVSGGLFGSNCVRHEATLLDSYTQPYTGTNAPITAGAPGEKWTGSVYVKAADAASAGKAVSLFVFALDASYNIINFTNADGQAVTTKSDEWTRFEVTHTMPANTAYVSMRVDNDGGAGCVVLWDGFQLEKSAYAKPFIDGTRAEDVTLQTVALGETLTASFPNDGIAAGTQYTLLRRRRTYTADRGEYVLHHELAESERVGRVQDLLQRVHERMRRVEDSVMGRAAGEIMDLIRTASDSFKVTSSVSVSEATVGSATVGSAEVGFSSVA